jgi:hypothetical protein
LVLFIITEEGAFQRSSGGRSTPSNSRRQKDSKYKTIRHTNTDRHKRGYGRCSPRTSHDRSHNKGNAIHKWAPGGLGIVGAIKNKNHGGRIRVVVHEGKSFAEEETQRKGAFRPSGINLTHTAGGGGSTGGYK